MRNVARLAAGACALAAGAAVAPHAFAAPSCAEAGVVTKIVGSIDGLQILRGGAPVERVRVLEPVCAGDRITARAGTTAALSLDQSAGGKVTVDAAHPFSVPSKAANGVAQNGWNLALFNLSRDMKRRPWDVRLRGPGPELGFALASLPDTPQQLTTGHSKLLVRLDGGVGAYEVSIKDTAGAVKGQTQSKESDVIVPLAGQLPPGDYVITVKDTAGTVVEGKVKVVADKPPSTIPDDSFSDPEVRVAISASDLARQQPKVWALEAEQMLFNAPTGSLDRGSVYELIEDYDDQ